MPAQSRVVRRKLSYGLQGLALPGKFSALLTNEQMHTGTKYPKYRHADRYGVS